MNQQELFNKKLEIGKKAGKLTAEINQLMRLSDDLKTLASGPYTLEMSFRGYSYSHKLTSREFEGDGTVLHNSLIDYFQKQIDERKAELNELIKIAQ